ncbi:hypothetical protein BGZ97_008519, partial [Linnemannia gamsii]
LARAKEQLETCFRFFEGVSPYWAIGADHLEFLKSLLAGDLSGIMGGASAAAAAPETATTSATADGPNNAAGSGHLRSATAGSSADIASTGGHSVTAGVVDRLTVSRAEAKETSSAFLTTDSGMNTVWLDAESLSAVEEATVKSLSKMSLLHQTTTSIADKPKTGSKKPLPPPVPVSMSSQEARSQPR